jgi:hypothetical protein
MNCITVCPSLPRAQHGSIFVGSSPCVPSNHTETQFTYDYNDAAHKHAVTHLNGVQKYWYDANGNMTIRISGSNTYNFTYDAVNHLTSFIGATTASFAYDAATPQALLISNRFAVATSTLNFLLSDHCKQPEVAAAAPPLPPTAMGDVRAI